MTYENFIVPNIYWEYVLGQHRVSFINEYYKTHKNYPSDEILQKVVLTDEEKEKYKRIFYAKYKTDGVFPSEPNTPIIPPISDDEIEAPDNPIILPSSGNNEDGDYVICTYNIANSGGTKLYQYRTDRENYIENIIYDGKEITPFSINTSSLVSNHYYACYDFGKLGDVIVKYKLKEGTTSMDYVWFGDTRITEVVIPSCITTIQNDFEYVGGIFSNSSPYLTKITSLSKTAPVLKKPIISTHLGNGNYISGTLYVPKDCAINYTSWMGNGISDGLLASNKWFIKELEY